MINRISGKASIGSMADGIHPGDAGNVLLANILKRYLVDYVG